MSRWLFIFFTLLAASAFANVPRTASFSTTNRNGKKWQFQFDAANRLTNTITPLGRSTTTAYNDRGLAVFGEEPSGQTQTLSYDAKGRLTNRTDSVGTTLYRYDANDNLTNIIENGSPNSWTFDAYNRVQSYRDADGNLIQYRHDANGNITNLIYPGGKTVAYFYDSLNRLTNVTDWSGRKTVMTYDLASQLTSITRPNGSQRVIGYDAAGQMTNIIEKFTNNFPIAFFRLNWTNNGTMAWEFAAPLPHAATIPTRTMTYDDDNRLLTVNGSSVTNDADGNMVYGPLTNGAFSSLTYDARNRLLSAGGLSYTYDPPGNRTVVTNGAAVTKFVINPNAKLSQVLMRIKGGVTNYYIHGAGLLYEITETASITNTLMYHYDYRGSTVALTDSAGNITDRIEYSAYGLTTYRAGTNDTPFLFNGRYGVQTDANGLLYMRARYYNPHICRFINPDPAVFSGGLNFYAYANGNPVSYLDPFGLGAQTAGGRIDWLRTWNTIGAWTIPGAASAQNAYLQFDQGNYANGIAASVSMVGETIIGGLMYGQGSSVRSATAATTSFFGKIGNWFRSLFGSETTAVVPEGGLTPLYRAVNPAELADISASGGVFKNPVNMGGGIKYFSTTAEGAAAEAQAWWRAGGTLYQGPYTVVQTAFPTSMITPGMTATVDGGINSVIISTEQLPSLLLGQPLPFIPLP